MKIRTTIPNNNPYYIRQVSGGLNGAVAGSPTISGANVLANCVGYANGRFNEIINDPDLKGIRKTFKYQLVCNAENFIESAQRQGLKISKKPTVGGIMVWQKGATLGGGDGAGHVAIVEQIYSDGSIYTSESGWGSREWAFKNLRRNNSNGRWGQSEAYKFRGCIINPAVNGGVVPTPKLSVDGVGGELTVMRMQDFLNVQIIDGVISGQNSAFKDCYQSLVSVTFGGGGSSTVKALQKWVGVAQDGVISSGTVKAWQKKIKELGYYTGAIDGVFNKQSMKAYQECLNNNCKPKSDPDPKPTKEKYPGKLPTIAEIKTASNAGIRDNVCAWCKKIADGGAYKYKVFTDDPKTQECPICHNLKGKYKAFNCIGYAYASWRHGGGIPCRCNCGVVHDGKAEQILKASTDAEALRLAQNAIGIKDIKVIRNNGNTLPASKLLVGNILMYYEGNTYFHTLVYVGDGKVSDCGRGNNPNIKYGKKYDQKYCKVAIQYTGSYSYLQFGDRGSAVKKIQEFLNWYFDINLKINGRFNQTTLKYVRRFQKQQNLVVDGYVGEKTIAKMKEVKK